MNESVAPSWHSQHSRKIKGALLALTFLLVCNSLAAVLGFDAFLDPWRPRSSLMANLALFIIVALGFWRVRSMLLVVLSVIVVGLLVASSLTTS